MAKNSIYKSEEAKEQILNFYKSLLEQWPKPSKMFSLETDFGETFIIESGNADAPPIILLHGSGSNSAMWTADVKGLSKIFHVFAIDIIGECGLSAESRPPFKADIYSNWISAIIDKLGLRTISIIACSLGGWIALDFSIKYPQNVEKLVLMATAGVVRIKPRTIFWILITSITGNWGFNKLNEMVYGSMKMDSKALEFASLVKKYFYPRTDILPVFSDERLRQIEATALFIGGVNDCFYNSQETASRLNRNLKNVQCQVIENTGHVLLDQANRISQFLIAQHNEV